MLYNVHPGLYLSHATVYQCLLVQLLDLHQEQGLLFCRTTNNFPWLPLEPLCLCMLSHSVVSYSLRPHGLQPARFLCPWDSPGRNTRVGHHFLLQGIFPTQRQNPCLLHLLHWQVDSSPLCHLGSPLEPLRFIYFIFYVFDSCRCYVHIRPEKEVGFIFSIQRSSCYKSFYETGFIFPIDMTLYMQCYHAHWARNLYPYIINFPMRNNRKDGDDINYLV